MSYAIIRNSNYKKDNLAGLYKHNERKNTNYSNKNIDKTKTKENYAIKKCNTTYAKRFKDLKQEHDLKGRIISTTNIMCELIVTSDEEFFKNMTKEEIINKNEINIETKNITYIDISGLFGFDKIEIAISTIESIIRIFEKNNIKNCFFIFEKEYTRTIKENLYYLIDEVPQLEEKLNINIKINKSIVEISEEEFENLKKNITEKIYGNEKFKRRLIEEMRSFRVFNILGIQPILSIFVFGKPGIGKTETAKLIHNTLYKDEDIIKINFENYSDEHALSSLIGSPRGYIGSEQGELSEKISKSQAKVIIIDEFEKASKPIFNFFLQLLEEGKFTDSLGREYDLNQYLIIFTSNIDKNELNKKISPELFSRFSLFYKMIDLTNEEKEKYLRSRVDYIVELLKTKEIELSEQEIEEICSINIEKYDDLRKLNNDLKKSVAKKVYSKLHK